MQCWAVGAGGLSEEAGCLGYVFEGCILALAHPPSPCLLTARRQESLPLHAITVFCLVSGLTKAMGPVGVGTEASETMNPQLSFMLLLSRTCHKKKNQQFKD